MKKFALPLVFLCLLLTAIACGKLNEHFTRSVNGYTRISFSSPKMLGTLASQNGGILIYFLDQASQQSLTAFAFPNEDIANTSSVVVKNGNYKVYAISFAGGGSAGGQAKCGAGNGGQNILLDGAAKLVSINVNTADCSFGNNSAFSVAQNANAGTSNFDSWEVQFCSGNPYPSCSATSTSSSIRVSAMVGERFGLSTFAETPASLHSNCINSSSGVGSVTGFNPPLGGGALDYPFKVEVYGDASCSSSIVRSYVFPEGLYRYTATSSTSGTWVDMTATPNLTLIKLLRDF